MTLLRRAPSMQTDGRASPVAASPATSEGSASEPAALTTQGLTRDYGGTGLFDVSINVPHGSVYGLVGPNGAGKTTLLSIVTGLRHADKGTITLGVPAGAIAVCPDVPEFDGWLTATEVVSLAVSMTGRHFDASAVSRALGDTGLADAAHRRVGGFSRGMTQRLGLACAIVSSPQLVIFDEPTSALDPAGRAEVLDLVAGMRGSATAIFSSHILSDVQRIADHIGILRNGRLLYQGPTQQLIDEYLKPRWLVRLGDDRTQEVARRLLQQSWVKSVQRSGDRVLRVDADTLESGERGIPAVLAACRSRLVSCEPVAADLESAFLALTQQEG